MPEAVLGLGSNLGSRRALLASARALLAAQPGLVVRASSPLYHTPPLGPPQPHYLNAALKVAWPGSARSLLILCQQVEQLLARERALRWGPRTLDIDLLYWSAGEVAEPDLTIPHPALTERLFALVPLLDVAPELGARFASALGPDAPGFAPSEPFLERAARVAGHVESAPSDDPLELLAALPSALAAFAPPAQGPLYVLPFSVPIQGEAASLDTLEGPLSALEARVRAACALGFRVAGGVITEVGAGRCQGRFIGLHDPACAPLPPLARRLVLTPRGRALAISST